MLRSSKVDAVISASDCSVREFSDHRKVDMKLSQYVEYFTSRDRAQKPPMYLKDWHFVTTCGAGLYAVPPLFADDWLNDYLAHVHSSDFRFCYLGPAKTWTPFHSCCPAATPF
jgi:hypothetical protein